MISSHYGLQRTPFDTTHTELLKPQQEILDMLLVHAQQGGLCLVLGEPGTGKSVIKEKLISHDQRRIVTPVVNRTMHTYTNTVRIMCQAFQIPHDGRDSRCESLLIEEAFKLYRKGKMIVPIIDDVHLMQADSLRKLRLLFEDFPRSHNLVLFGQPHLLQTLSLTINEEIRSRVTYSAILQRMAHEDIQAFLLDQIERAGLGSNVFTDEALDLIARSADGILRKARNLALGALVETVRDQTRTVDIKQVNAVLAQPHWRKDYDAQTT